MKRNSTDGDMIDGFVPTQQYLSTCALIRNDSNFNRPIEELTQATFNTNIAAIRELSAKGPAKGTRYLISFASKTWDPDHEAHDWGVSSLLTTVLYSGDVYLEKIDGARLEKLQNEEELFTIPMDYVKGLELEEFLNGPCQKNTEQQLG